MKYFIYYKLILLKGVVYEEISSFIYCNAISR